MLLRACVRYTCTRSRAVRDMILNLNHIFHLKIIFFTTLKNCSILHGRVFVMHYDSNGCKIDNFQMKT